MRAAMVPLVAIAALLALPARSEDKRPTEIPYETPGEIPTLSPEYRVTSHKVVLITNDALEPRLVTIDEGQLIAWISYSPTASTVVFEREVARNMVCHSLVNFTIKDDELRSAPIHTGEFASFCQLKPGHYRYKVVRESTADHVDAPKRLDGEIIVGNAAK